MLSIARIKYSSKSYISLINPKLPLFSISILKSLLFFYGNNLNPNFYKIIQADILF